MSKNILSKYDTIIKELLIHQCISLLNKFKCIYKLTDEEYNLEQDNILKEINNLVVNIKIKKLTKTPKIKKEISHEARCTARIFNYHNILRKTDKGIIYGSQCTRAKVPNNKYCKHHLINIPHGDYLEPASDYIKLHYKKEYALYVKKEKPKLVISF
jgi:hypothetical protein